MVIAIGCDITDHTLIKKLKWSTDESLQKRYFSEQEIEQFKLKNDLQFLAGRFAVKEAVLKCLGIGMEDGLSLREIQTLKSINGRPELQLFGVARKISEKLGIDYWHVSITHSKNCSMAYVIAEKKLL